jgi:hypothetical protein
VAIAQDFQVGLVSVDKYNNNSSCMQAFQISMTTTRAKTFCEARSANTKSKATKPRGKEGMQK